MRSWVPCGADDDSGADGNDDGKHFFSSSFVGRLCYPLIVFAAHSTYSLAKHMNGAYYDEKHPQVVLSLQYME